MSKSQRTREMTTTRRVLFRSLLTTLLVGALVACSHASTGIGDAEGTSGALRDLEAQEAEFLRLINEYRGSKGLSPLVATKLLDQVAYDHSLDMATHAYFDHNDLAGKSPFDRMRAAGYQGGWMAENIAAGNDSAAATFEQWKTSPGHDANMLGTHYKAIGIGRAHADGSPYGWYWTTDFGDVVDASQIPPGSADAGVAADAASGDGGVTGEADADAGAACTPEREPNDSYTTPNALETARASCGAVDPASDQDWFSWSIDAAGAPYDVVLTTTGDAELLMWQRVGNGYTRIANTLPSEIKATSTSAGPFVLAVWSPSGTKQSYTLTLTR
jgi:uncharacterized protein YkwD